MKDKHIYRIKFYNQGDVYEIYAHEVSHDSMYGFVEVNNILFNERSQLLVDPTEEKLKLEFENVKRTYIPLQSIVRIDQVNKEGCSKIITTEQKQNNNITHFPTHPIPPRTPDKT
ncbi:hypothetical protein MNBD_GAMMA12-2336 [hydrothermal vent metagenome]|uniref:DUF1820 domain-containing protein n=1 Tax=hydrothermal vent metagenome TaxID=652676 RepID=A0A3B0YUS2_9ZZZZ